MALARLVLSLQRNLQDGKLRVSRDCLSSPSVSSGLAIMDSLYFSSFEAGKSQLSEAQTMELFVYFLQNLPAGTDAKLCRDR